MKIKAEERVLNFLQNHIDYILLALILCLSVGIRFTVRFFENGDAINYLIPWYEQIKANGGIFGGLSKPIYSFDGTVCNYSFVYQFFLAILSHFPIKPLYGIKLLSCIFDYLTMFELARIITLLIPEKKVQKSRIAVVVFAFHPVVFMNSALWGQCDVIYCFWILLALDMFLREKHRLGFIFYGIAFAFKLQAVFFLPFLLFYYFYKKRFSIINFLLIPITVLVMNIPAFIQGRTIKDLVSIYTGNTSMYKIISMGYPSFWNIISDGLKKEGYSSLKYVAIAITVAALAVHMYVWIKRRVALTSKNMVYMAFLLTFTTVFFLPSMHERYGFVYEVMALIVLMLYNKTLPLYIGLSIITLVMYGKGLYSTTYNVVVMAVANLIIYIGYTYLLTKKMLKTQSQ